MMTGASITQVAWGPILSAARRGDMPGLRIGCTAADVARGFGGRQPVYLATPYSRECLDEGGQWNFLRSEQLARAAAHAADDLRIVGITAISPIVQAVAQVGAKGAFVARHGAPVRFEGPVDPLDAPMWARWCQPLLNVCGALVVPDIPGWDRSEGIYAELRYAVSHAVPVFVYGGAV